MNRASHELKHENKVKAIEAAEQLIDVLRPAAHHLAEMLNEAEQRLLEVSSEYLEAYSNADKEEKLRLSQAHSVWQDSVNRYTSELQTLDDAIQFAKRLLPNKNY
jgi:hypothetical protein